MDQPKKSPGILSPTHSAEKNTLIDFQDDQPLDDNLILTSGPSISQASHRHFPTAFSSGDAFTVSPLMPPHTLTAPNISSAGLGFSVTTPERRLSSPNLKSSTCKVNEVLNHNTVSTTTASTSIPTSTTPQPQNSKSQVSPLHSGPSNNSSHSNQSCSDLAQPAARVRAATSSRQFSTISTDYEYTEATSLNSDHSQENSPRIQSASLHLLRQTHTQLSMGAAGLAETQDYIEGSDSDVTLTDNENANLIGNTNIPAGSHLHTPFSTKTGSSHKKSSKKLGSVGLCGNSKTSRSPLSCSKLKKSTKHVQKLLSSPTGKISNTDRGIIKQQPSKYAYTSLPTHDLEHNYDFDKETREETSKNSTQQNKQGVNSRRRRTRVTDHPDDEVYVQAVRLAKRTIDESILPKLIAQGSSGSYFMQGSYRPSEMPEALRSVDDELASSAATSTNESSININSHENSQISEINGERRRVETIAVFKPKNEEPYAVLNPKWTKWVQRNFCFCCFGRNCLIQNQGFTSEAAASVVDKHFQIGLVPLTGVVRLSSESFYYTKIDRMKAQAKAEFSQRFPSVGRRFRRIGLPPKQGSFQLFVKGFQPANYYLRQFELEPPDEDLEADFLYQFQKLTCLDYIIRNTDRGADNWLIKYVPQNSQNGCRGTIEIAAIDNGLAFPYKHPDAWRTYPYSWSWLEISRKPYSRRVITELLPLLSNSEYIAKLEQKIVDIFKVDRSFSKSVYEKQMSVMRGQILNLTQALRDGRSPTELVQMPPVYVKRAKKNGTVFGRIRSATLDQFTQSFQRRKPFFSGI